MTNYVITNKLVKVCKAEGMIPAALEDWPESHEKDFVVNSAGKIRSRIGDLKVKDYVRAVKERTPTFFRDPGENTKGKNNPWTAEGWSITRQGALIKANPQGAAEIAAKAGSWIGATRPGATKKLSSAYERTASGRPQRT